MKLTVVTRWESTMELEVPKGVAWPTADGGVDLLEDEVERVVIDNLSLPTILDFISWEAVSCE